MAATKNKERKFDLSHVPDGDRQRLEAMIPAPEIAEAYTNRVLAGGKTDFEYFEAARRLKHNVLMAGPSGAGKTTAARAFAAHMAAPFGSVEFNGAMDPAATLGANLVDPETGLPKWVDGEITLIVRYGGIVMLDEVNFAPPRFTAAFHGVLDARQTLYVPELGIRVKKHPQTLVFSAYNPRYTGINMLNEAFTNRWAFTIDPWDYDPQVEAERVGEYTPTLLRLVRDMRADNSVQGDIGTNTMEEFIWIAHELNIEAAIHLFLGKLDREDRGIAAKVLEAEKHNMADELGCEVADTDDEYLNLIAADEGV